MLQTIEFIIKTIGPRPAGSQEEKRTFDFLLSEFQKITPHVFIESFEDHLTAKFGKLKWFALVFLLCLILSFYLPWLAFFLSLLNSIFLYTDFVTDYNLLDPFFLKLTSWNLEATLEPQEQSKSTIIISSHADSTAEINAWYYFKQWGAYATVICGFMILSFPLAALFAAIFPSTIISKILYLYVLISPFSLAYLFFHGKKIIDGAQDNLSGVAINKAVFEHFYQSNGNSKLKNTTIKYVCFGAEERGLRGSKNYLKRHHNRLIHENSIILNIDSVRLVNEVSIVTGEKMSGTKHDFNLADNLETQFRKLHRPFKKGIIPIGGTDAQPFSRNGIPAISIIGIPMKKLDETYHTRRDTIGCIEPQALENVKDVLISFIEEWDKK